MQWVVLSLVGFLIVGLRRSSNATFNSVAVVIVAAAVLIVWFTQMSSR
jgi:hypothetical protein